MKIRVVDVDAGNGYEEKFVDQGMTVRDYFRHEKDGADISKYTVMVNNVKASPHQALSPNDYMTISPQKPVGACAGCF